MFYRDETNSAWLSDDADEKLSTHASTRNQ